MNAFTIDQLVEQVEVGDELETAVLVKRENTLGEARIIFSAKEGTASTKWRGSVANTSFSSSDISSLFAWIEQHGKATDTHLLLDTLSVQKKAGYGFVPVDQNMYTTLLSAWKKAFYSRIVEGKQEPEIRDLIEGFDQQLQSLDRCLTSMWLSEQGVLREIEFTYFRHNGCADVYIKDSPVSPKGFYFRSASIPTVVAAMDHLARGGDCILETLLVKIHEKDTGPIGVFINTNESLYKLASALWRAISNTSTSTQPGCFDPDLARKQAWQQHVSSCLTAGETGISWWNTLTDGDKKECTFANMQLSNQNLSGLILGSQSFRGCNFDQSTMKKSEATTTDLAQASFRNTNLSGSKFLQVNADGVDFSHAGLSKVKFLKSCLRNAIFAQADLSSVDLKGSDLRGVDLRACVLPDAKKLAKAHYDEFTKFPPGFSPIGCLVWKGTGPDPHKLELMKDVNSDVLDFSGFLYLIQSDFDSGRVSKAIGMLKKERFNLYCEQSDSGVFGIIKSQTDAKLLYACKLGSEGTFCCCTQNLNACGGLRGALCKHILCLVIGLTKAGQLDANTAARCIIASMKETPVLAADEMSGLFLKFAGATGGELDWRPTETIPEDYYEL